MRCSPISPSVSANAWECCGTFARNMPHTYPHARTPDLLLMGQSGLGKTFLMHAMAKRLLDRGLNVLMLSAYRFLDIARKAYFSNNTGELDTLMETDVLMLDDLGSEPLMENITIVQLFNLSTKRHTSREGHGHQHEPEHDGATGAVHGAYCVPPDQTRVNARCCNF